MRFSCEVRIRVTIVWHLSLAIFPLFFAFRIALKNHSSSEPRHEFSLSSDIFLNEIFNYRIINEGLGGGGGGGGYVPSFNLN